ncbi:hypothetical protein MKW98_011388 [Papaver atlanticum]|uniref:SANT domain-containing protein n=1 Tax=Papaver atlanticum TaxID=357466 RepID=A0AAD4XLC6_9MAGN|nr:hypothetical protein MKW98_011388 [Papaver atlanticum]
MEMEFHGWMIGGWRKRWRLLIILLLRLPLIWIADPTAGNNSSPYQSTSFTQDTPFEEEVPFAYEEDQAARFVQPELNYHTFMSKTLKKCWSKQDTDLFYEAIQQFGTDFSLIQHLFPGRTRYQLKLKYKKEERQQPMRLSDALTNRSKNHSHFELVIGRLEKAVQLMKRQSMILTEMTTQLTLQEEV